MGRVVGYRDLGLIGTSLQPILLRRRKAEVLVQLPERVDKTLFVPMTAEQRVHHDENGAQVTRIVARWRKTGFLADVDQLSKFMESVDAVTGGMGAAEDAPAPQAPAAAVVTTADCRCRPRTPCGW